jgi:alkaline phosphatase
VCKSVCATTSTVVLSALIAALALAGTGEAQGVQPAGERAKNVIIFIGDGMGTSHAT